MDPDPARGAKRRVDALGSRRPRACPGSEAGARSRPGPTSEHANASASAASASAVSAAERFSGHGTPGPIARGGRAQAPRSAASRELRCRARPAGSETLIAAVPGPSIQRTGAAIEISPTSYSSSETATPCLADRGEIGGQLVPGRAASAPFAADRAPRRARPRRQVLGQLREQALAERGAVGRQPHARPTPASEQPIAGLAQQVDDVRALEDRQVDRLLHERGEPQQMGPRELGKPHPAEQRRHQPRPLETQSQPARSAGRGRASRARSAGRRGGAPSASAGSAARRSPSARAPGVPSANSSSTSSPRARVPTDGSERPRRGAARALGQRPGFQLSKLAFAYR